MLSTIYILSPHKVGYSYTKAIFIISLRCGQVTPCVMGAPEAEPQASMRCLATPPRWHDAEYSCR